MENPHRGIYIMSVGSEFKIISFNTNPLISEMKEKRPRELNGEDHGHRTEENACFTLVLWTLPESFRITLSPSGLRHMLLVFSRKALLYDKCF